MPNLLLTSRTYRLLWIANLVNLLGDAFGQFALYLGVFRLTGETDVFALSGILFTGSLTSFLTALTVAGTLVARFDVRHAFAASCLLKSVLWVGVLLAYRAQIYWLIVLLVGIQGLGTATLLSASFSLTCRSVDRPQLFAANGLLAFGNVLASMAGPALAGLLADATSLTWLFIADAMSYQVCIVLVLLMPAMPAAERRGGSTLGAFWSGLKQVTAGVETRVLLLIALLASLADAVGRATFVPLTRAVFHASPAAMGLTQGAGGLGATGGTIATNLGVIQSKRKLTILIVAFVALSLVFTISALAPAIHYVTVLMVFAGLFGVPALSAHRAMVQAAAPPELEARMGSILHAAYTAGILLGAASSAPVAGLFGIRVAWGSQGAAHLICFLLGVWLLLVRRRRAHQPHVG